MRIYKGVKCHQIQIRRTELGEAIHGTVDEQQVALQGTRDTRVREILSQLLEALKLILRLLLTSRSRDIRLLVVLDLGVDEFQRIAVLNEELVIEAKSKLTIAHCLLELQQNVVGANRRGRWGTRSKRAIEGDAGLPDNGQADTLVTDRDGGTVPLNLAHRLSLLTTNVSENGLREVFESVQRKGRKDRGRYVKLRAEHIKGRVVV